MVLWWGDSSSWGMPFLLTLSSRWPTAFVVLLWLRGPWAVTLIPEEAYGGVLGEAAGMF